MSKIIWLGDSQTQSGNFPKGAAAGSGFPINYYGQVSARASNYTNGKGTGQTIGTNISALTSKNPTDALNYAISNNFDVAIIVLGHNNDSTSNYNKMVSKLKNGGVKQVFLVWMYAVPGGQYGMTGSSKQVLSNQYSGVTDVTHIKVLVNETVQTQDSIHATASEATRCGKLVGNALRQMLSGNFTADSGSGGFGNSGNSGGFGNSGTTSSCNFDLQTAISWAKTHESGKSRGDCTGGTGRIMKAGGYNMDSGVWYSDPWSNNNKPTGGTPPEKAGFKVYALGETIKDIRTLSGGTYVPKAGDVATYYGGNNPEGKWFKMPADYHKRIPPYPSGYLYHTACFLGDDVGWWADFSHQGLDRPYKGIDCYSSVTNSGKPSTHVTIYRHPCVGSSGGSESGGGNYVVQREPEKPDDETSYLTDVVNVEVVGEYWDVFEDFSKLLDDNGDSPTTNIDSGAVVTPQKEITAEITGPYGIKKSESNAEEIEKTVQASLNSLMSNTVTETGAVAGITKEEEIAEIMSKSDNTIKCIDGLNPEDSQNETTSLSENTEGQLDMNHGKCPYCGKPMEQSTRDGFCSPICSMSSNLKQIVTINPKLQVNSEEIQSKITNLTESANGLLESLDNAESMIQKINELGLDPKYEAYFKLRMNTIIQSLQEKIFDTNIIKNQNLLGIIETTVGGFTDTKINLI